MVEFDALFKSDVPTVRISYLLYPDPLLVKVTLLTTPVEETTIVALAPDPAPPDSAISRYVFCV